MWIRRTKLDDLMERIDKLEKECADLRDGQNIYIPTGKRGAFGNMTYKRVTAVDFSGKIMKYLGVGIEYADVSDQEIKIRSIEEQQKEVIK